MKLIKNIVLLTLTSIPTLVFAGDLVTDARIVEVMNSYNGSKDFAVRIETSTATGGACVNVPYIVFPEPIAGSSSLSESAFDQAFSMALVALANGNRVRIHDFDGDLCTGADFLLLKAK